MPQIIYWQTFYFAVVIVRGGQVIPWLEGTGRALLLLPKMLKKRADINKRRKVSLSYLEEVIVRSEEELAESRKRLVEQSQATETK